MFCCILSKCLGSPSFRMTSAIKHMGTTKRASDEEENDFFLLLVNINANFASFVAPTFFNVSWFRYWRIFSVGYLWK